MKPFAERVKNKAPSRLVHMGEPREDLLYYLDRPVQEAHEAKDVENIIDNAETLLLVKGSQSGPLLEKYPHLRVILETKDMFRQYQLLGPVSALAKH